MAMVCMYHNRECNGCMTCYDDEMTKLEESLPYEGKDIEEEDYE